MGGGISKRHMRSYGSFVKEGRQFAICFIIAKSPVSDIVNFVATW